MPPVMAWQLQRSPSHVRRLGLEDMPALTAEIPLQKGTFGVSSMDQYQARVPALVREEGWRHDWDVAGSWHGAGREALVHYR